MRRGVLIAGVVLIAFGLAMLSFYMLNSELHHETGVKRLNPNGQEGISLPGLQKGDRIHLEFVSDESIIVWISPNRDPQMDINLELIASNVSSGSYTFTVPYSGTWYVFFQAGEEDTFVDYDIQVQNKFGQFSLILGPVFLIFGAVVIVAGFRLEKPAGDKISEIEAALKIKQKGSKGKKADKGGKKASGKETPPSKGKPVPKKGKPAPKGKPRPARKAAAGTVFESEEEKETFDPELKRDLPAWDALDRAITGEGKPQTEEDPSVEDEAKPEPESPPRDGFSGWAEEEKPEKPAAEPKEEEVKSLPCVMCGGRMFRDARNEWVCDHCGNRI